MQRYVVVGDPISHSRSPDLHREFARTTGQVIDYQRVQVASGQLGAYVEAFRRQGGQGLNVTLPLKLEALNLARWAGRRARIAGAANTLWWDASGGLCAENTDGIGLLRDLQGELAWPLAGAQVLILGAGGAVRGLIPELFAAGAANITLANRSPERARDLQRHLGTWGYPLRLLAGGERLGSACDLLINATSAGVAGSELPVLPVDLDFSRLRFYDLMYGATAAPFARQLAAAGVVNLADGLGMLVEQAAQAFWIWRGIHPDTRAVRARLRVAIATASSAS